VATWTTAEGKMITERLSGFEARIFQHELDHLAGVLCVDLAEPGTVNLSTEDPVLETFRPLP
jgi:peptide deformylase